jgi:hypothetical protein
MAKALRILKANLNIRRRGLPCGDLGWRGWHHYIDL